MKTFSEIFTWEKCRSEAIGSVLFSLYAYHWTNCVYWDICQMSYLCRCFVSTLRLRGAMLESRLGHCLSWQRFLLIFLSPARQMLGMYLKVGHGHFLPHPSRLTVYCVLCVNDRAVSKLQIENKYTKLWFLKTSNDYPLVNEAFSWYTLGDGHR